MKEVKDFERLELFKHYHDMDNPFIIMTIPLNVTKVVNYVKEHGHFYATLGFLIGKAVNDIPQLHYRYVDNKFYYYPKIAVNFTERVDDQIGFFECESDTLKEFCDEFVTKKANLGKYDNAEAEYREDVIWVTCFPWAKFNSLMTPHDKNITIPQFTWDKYEEVNGEFYCNLMLTIHHGLVDGYHVAMFIEKLNKYINDLH